MKTATSPVFFASLVVLKKHTPVILVALVTGLICSGSPAASAERSVNGEVDYAGGEPARGAAVQLKNVTSLQIVSQISDKLGHFHFDGLNPEIDYEVRAMKNGHWSKAHRVSHFSSKPVEEVKLTLSADVSDK